jgi:hypothetical protein
MTSSVVSFPLEPGNAGWAKPGLLTVLHMPKASRFVPFKDLDDPNGSWYQCLRRYAYKGLDSRTVSPEVSTSLSSIVLLGND